MLLVAGCSSSDTATSASTGMAPVIVTDMTFGPPSTVPSDAYDGAPDPEFDIYNVGSARADEICAAIDMNQVRLVLYDVPDLQREATGSSLFNGAPTCIITTSAYAGAVAAVTLIDTADPSLQQSMSEDLSTLRELCVESRNASYDAEYDCLSDLDGATPGYVHIVSLRPNPRFVLRSTFALGGPNADRQLTENEVFDLNIWLTGWVTGTD